MEHETLTSNSTGPASAAPAKEFDALQAVVGALQPLSAEARERILGSVATFLGVSSPPRGALPRANALGDSPRAAPSAHAAYSDDTAMTPKEFLLEKQPRTDVERIACLAFYLTHYQDTPHFKTLDLSKLNTAAAQPKFSNAAQASNNAVKTGYLVASTKGQRQISAAGEQFVRALPDREAARGAMASARPRRRLKRPKASSNSSES